MLGIGCQGETASGLGKNFFAVVAVENEFGNMNNLLCGRQKKFFRPLTAWKNLL